jgi:hypothetical protein
MTKISKKELNKKVSDSVAEIFSEHNKKAALKIEKELNDLVKDAVKKFSKAVKKIGKKTEKLTRNSPIQKKRVVTRKRR